MMSSQGLSPIPTGSNCAATSRASSIGIEIPASHNSSSTNDTDVKISEVALRSRHERSSSGQSVSSLSVKKDWKRCGKIILFTALELSMVALTFYGLFKDKPGMAIGGASGGLVVSGGGLLIHRAGYFL